MNSFSRLNPEWESKFASQPEIKRCKHLHIAPGTILTSGQTGRASTTRTTSTNEQSITGPSRLLLYVYFLSLRRHLMRSSSGTKRSPSGTLLYSTAKILMKSTPITLISSSAQQAGASSASPKRAIVFGVRSVDARFAVYRTQTFRNNPSKA